MSLPLMNAVLKAKTQELSAPSDLNLNSELSSLLKDL